MQKPLPQFHEHDDRIAVAHGSIFFCPCPHIIAEAPFPTVVTEGPDACILLGKRVHLLDDDIHHGEGCGRVGCLVERMAKAVIVVVGLDQVGERVTDVVTALPCPADAPAEFHALVGAVVATLAGLRLTAAVHIPHFLHLVVFAVLVEDLQILHLDVAHVVERDETLRALIAHLAHTFFHHLGIAVVLQMDQDKHRVNLVLGTDGQTGKQAQACHCPKDNNTTQGVHKPHRSYRSHRNVLEYVR